MDENREPNRNPAGRRIAGLLALLATPMLAAACGASSSTGTVTPQGPVSAGAGATTAAPATDLTIVVNDGAGKTDRWTLTCDPAGGSHPNPSTACSTLAEHGKTALPPVSKSIMCTQLYGGPQTATITGTWDGKAVDASLSRHNGCEVSRWKQLTGLLPAEANTAGGVT